MSHRVTGGARTRKSRRSGRGLGRPGRRVCGRSGSHRSRPHLYLRGTERWRGLLDWCRRRHSVERRLCRRRRLGRGDICGGGQLDDRRRLLGNRLARARRTRAVRRHTRALCSKIALSNRNRGQEAEQQEQQRGAHDERDARHARERARGQCVVLVVLRGARPRARFALLRRSFVRASHYSLTRRSRARE